MSSPNNSDKAHICLQGIPLALCICNGLSPQLCFHQGHSQKGGSKVTLYPGKKPPFFAIARYSSPFLIISTSDLPRTINFSIFEIRSDTSVLCLFSSDFLFFNALLSTLFIFLDFILINVTSDSISINKSSIEDNTSTIYPFFALISPIKNL